MKALRLFAVVALVLVAGAVLRHTLQMPEPVAPRDRAAVSAAIEREGIAMSFELTPRGGMEAGPLATHGEADIAITLTDAATGQPLRGLRPLAWMSKDRPGTQPPLDDASCRDRIRGYLGGLIATRPDVDLNGYLVVTLNDGNTLSVINPQIAFGRTKLEQVITLSGEPKDWVLDPKRRTLFLTLPEVDRLAVVDTGRLRVVGNVSTGSRPGRVALAPGGRTVWVGNDGDATVTVVDGESRRVLATLATGPGRHELAFHEGSRTAWVASAGSPRVEVYDLDELGHLGTVDVGFEVRTIAASPLARAVYVAGATGRVVAIDPDRRRVAQSIEVEGAISALLADPTGRWIFAASRPSGSLAVIDASSGAVRHAWTGLGEPDAIAFSDDFVYVRDRSGQRVSLLDRAHLGTAGGPALVEVPVGQRAPADARGHALASPIVATPEPGTVLIANPADRAIFLYREGMMAPAGTHLTYGREPRAVLVLDRSLEERSDGRHETTATLRGNGSHTVAMLLESPRIATCFRLQVEGVRVIEAPEGPSVALTALHDEGKSFPPGQRLELRFRLDDREGEPPAADEVSVVVHRPPSNHQWRPTPTALGDGTFAISFTPPTAGLYRVLAAVPSRGVHPGDLRPLDVTVAVPQPQIGKAAP